MILIVIVGLVAIVTVAFIVGSHRWNSATKEMHARLEALVCLSRETLTGKTNRLTCQHWCRSTYERYL